MTQVSVQEHEIDLPVNHFPQPLLQQGGTIVSVPLSIEDDATITMARGPMDATSDEVY